MKREDLQALGLTDEQIEKVMAEHGKDIQSANAKSAKYKEDAEKLAEVQKQLEEIQSANLSDVEKANKERDSALDQIAGLQSQIKAMTLKTKLADKGITGEDADKLVESISKGEFDVELLGTIIASKESAAATAKEQEIAKGSINPGGGNANKDGKPDKTEAEKFAESIGKQLSASDEASKSVVDSYL